MALKCKSCPDEPEPGRKQCLPCLEKGREYNRAWRAKNPEKARQYGMKFYRGNRDREIVMHRLRKYGLTIESHAAMLEAQGGVCAICRQPEWVLGPTGKVKSLAIDHCHDTGVVRGLLCNNCNRALGLLGDSVDLLIASIAYLSVDRSGLMAGG